MNQLAVHAVRMAEHEQRQTQAAAAAYQDWVGRGRAEEARYAVPAGVRRN